MNEEDIDEEDSDEYLFNKMIDDQVDSVRGK